MTDKKKENHRKKSAAAGGAAETPPQKDLTNLIQYAKKLEERGELPDAPEGAVMEESALDKIEDFESLEAYAVKNPPAEPSAPPLAVEEPSENVSELSGPSTDFPTSEASPEGENFLQTSESGDSDPGNIDEIPAFLESSNENPDPIFAVEPPVHEFATSEFPTEPATPPEASESFPEFLEQNPGADEPLDPFSESPTVPAPSWNENEGNKKVKVGNQINQEIRAPESVTASKLSALPPSTHPPSVASVLHSLEKVKKYSENIPAAKSTVPAAYPFSLMITGQLTAQEKEKLLDLLAREKMGFREIDLEPQLESGKILIPRISEYAGVLLVQALRGVKAHLRFGPSDQIFASVASQDVHDDGFDTDSDESMIRFSTDLTDPIENLPLTSGEYLPQVSSYSVLDTVTASAVLKKDSVEVEITSEYQDMVESLQRELKYKAFRKGAQAIIHFKVQLNYLSSPAHYRMLASGTAVEYASISNSPGFTSALGPQGFSPTDSQNESLSTLIRDALGEDDESNV